MYAQEQTARALLPSALKVSLFLLLFPSLPLLGLVLSSGAAAWAGPTCAERACAHALSSPLIVSVVHQAQSYHSIPYPVYPLIYLCIAATANAFAFQLLMRNPGKARQGTLMEWAVQASAHFFFHFPTPTQHPPTLQTGTMQTLNHILRKRMKRKANGGTTSQNPIFKPSCSHLNAVT